MSKQPAFRKKITNRFIIIIVSVWIADLLTKIWAIKTIKGGEIIRIIGDVFRLRYVENEGGVFGIFQGYPYVFHILTGIAIIFLLVYYVKSPEDSNLYNLAISFVIGGALGNFTDRFFRKGVVDFIDMGWGDSRWPTYNVADIFISSGAILLAMAFYALEKQARKAAKD